MIWKTTNSLLVNFFSGAFCYLKTYGVALPVLTILISLGNIHSGYSQEDTANCDITKTGCPPDDLIEPCGNVTFEDVLGNYVNWTEPDFSLDCGDENGYSYQISFDLPESQEDCWSFHKVQRVGTDSGVLNLWKSDGNASGTALVTSPSFYINETIAGSMDITTVSGQQYNVNVYLLGPNGKSPLMDSFLVTGTGNLESYDFSINPANYDGSGTYDESVVYRIRFEYIPVGKVTNANFVELITIDAGLFGVACAEEANFAVTQTHNPGDFFPVGTTTVTYTASCNGCTPVIEDSCSFNVIVNPTPDAPSVTTNLLEECAQDPVQELDANLALVNTTNVTWYDSLEGGSVVTSPTLNTVGSVKYFAEKVVNGCNSLTRTAVTLKLNKAPSKPVVTSNTDTTCDLDNGNITFTVEPGLTYTLTNTGTSNNTYSHSSGVYSNLPAGTYNLVASTDECDSQATQVIISATDDTQDPNLSISADRSENTDDGVCSASITISDAVFSDNCSGAVLTWEMSGVTTQSGSGQIGTFAFNKGVTNIEYTVTDASNNTTAANFTVTVTDNEDPTITVGGEINQNTDINSCSATVNVPAVDFDDNCTGSSISYTFIGDTTGSGNGQVGTQSFNIGTTTINYTVTDAAGRTANASVPVTISDNEDPTITVGGEINQNTDIDSCSATVEVPDVDFDDNCAGSSLSYTLTGDTTGSGNGQVGTQSFNIGTTTINYTVTDAAGRTANATVTVNISDNEDPTITVGSSIDQDTDTGSCVATVDVPAVDFDDNCAGSSLSYILTGDTTGSGNGQVGTESFNIGSTTINYTVTDAAGRTANASVTVTISDNEDPTITVGSSIDQDTDTGSCVATVDVPAGDFDDNCVGSSLSYTLTGDTTGSGNGQVGTESFNIGTTTINYTVTDATGNTITASVIVTISDNEDPTITVGSSIDQDTDTGSCVATVDVPAVDFDDNCAGSSLVYTLTGDTTGSGNGQVGTQSFNIGSTTINYTVTDAAGKTATAIVTVTISDNEDPTITVGSSIDQDTDTGSCVATVDVPAVDFDDNCAGSTLSYLLTGDTTGSGNGQVGTESFNIGSTTINYTVTDAAGRTANATITVNISDKEDPTLTVGSSIDQNTDFGSCSATVEVPAVDFDDNCAGSTLSYTLTGDTTGSGNGQVGTESFNIGTTTINYTVIDAAGRAVSAGVTVNITDNEDPVVETMNNIEVNSDAGVCGAVVNFNMIGATDNCEIASIEVTEGLTSGSTFPIGTTSVTWTVTDASGNSTTTSFDVIVTDNENPVISCPGDMNMPAEEGQDYAVVNFDDATATDNCNVTVTQTGGAASGSQFTLGQHEIEFTATDENGNTDVCSFTINVTDGQPPVINCPGDITQNVDAGICGAVVTFQTPVATDNSGSVTVEQTEGPTSGSVFPVGTTTITFTATDEDNNSVDCSFDITVIDNEAPVITCPGDITIGTEPDICSVSLENLELGMATATDNCDGEITITNNAPATFPLGTTEVTWTATDVAGNSVTCIQNVTVEDNQAPVITACAGDVTVDADNGICSASQVNLGTVSATDNCDSELTITNDAPEVFELGDTTVTWTVEDNAGNKTTCTQTVTVEDNENPVIAECPATVSVSADAGICSASEVELGMPVATDNCDNDLEITNNAPEVFELGDTTVTWTVTDAAGNTATCTQTVTVIDDQAPVVETMSNITVDSDPGVCGAVVEFGMIGATDNCEIASVEVTEGLTSGSTFPIGTTSVTWTVTDASGNSITTSFDVIVTDNENPVISCPGDMTAPAEEGQDYAVVNFDDATATDNCNVTVTQTGGAASGSQFTLGQHEIEFTATDENGNTDVCSFTINVTDGQPPVINCPGDITQNVDAGICGAVVTFQTPVATDNSGSVTVEQTEGPTSGSVFPVGTTTITFTATDEDNNSVDCSFDITVIDNEAPVITCPGDITIGTEPDICSVSLENLELGMATATDNCDGEITITNNAPATFPLGTTEVTWTATDVAGNSVTCIQNVTVEDKQAPVITACAGDVTVDADNGICSASQVNLGTVSATDNCDSELTITNDAPEVFELGNTTVTWTVEDNAGNKTTCTQTVTVEDNENPVIAECPATVSVSADAGICSASEVELGMPVATDNCDNDLEITNNAPEVFELGDTTVTWTVTDAAGNTATCTQTVTVVDDQAPVVETMSNITVDSDPGICGAVVEFGMIGATDNCEIASIEVTEGLTSGSTFPVGTTSVTWTVTDASGNTATSSFTVTIEDNEAPEISCAGNITVNTQEAQNYAIVEFADATATDNCSVTVEQTAGPVSGSQFEIGITTVTYTATDAAGNTSECSFTITVEDNEDPKISCPSNIEQSNDDGICGAVIQFAEPEFSDNSRDVTIEQTAGLASGDIFPVGTTVITYKAIDAAGNTAECSFEVTVTDDEGPSIEQKDPITVNNDEGICGAIVNYSIPTASDNCGIESVELTDGMEPGSEFPNGTTSITYTATDTNGNTATSTFTVTVNDTEAPSIECPDSITVTVENGTENVIVEYTSVSTIDNCEGTTVELTEGLASGEAFPVGETIVTYTVTDAAGNSTSCSFTVTVNEEELPTPPAAPSATVTQATCAEQTGTITVDTVEGLTYSMDGVNFQEGGIFANLSPGIYDVVAQDEFGQISDLTTVEINDAVAEEIALVDNGTIDLCIEDSTFDLFELFTGEYDDTGVWLDTNNSGALDNGFIDPSMMELGTYTFTYQLEGNCPSTTNVSVSINDDCVVLDCSIEDIKDGISKAVTPNGDNKNDFFKVDLDLACGFTYNVKIFNRWGAKVFDAQNYQNNWDGYSDSSFTGSNQLPSGTYFYVLEIREGNFEPIQGYIYLGTK